MTDEGTKVTIRMGSDVIDLMEHFMGEHDIGNRSDFIRDAIKGYIAAQNSGGTQEGTESGIFVRFSETHLDAIQGLVDLGICLNAEEYVRSCVLEQIVTPEIRQEAINNAMRNAQKNAALK